MMPEYKDIDLSELALLAEKSSSELGAMDGGVLVDYETGASIAFVDKDTAMFVASSRSIVLELVRRLREFQQVDLSG